MKCKHCDGNGGYLDMNRWCFCEQCDGTGQDGLSNEEWLRQATFEELAGAIYEWHTLGYTRGKNGKKLNSITEVVEWLKEKHK